MFQITNRKSLQGRSLYRPIQVKTETFRKLSGPLVHTNFGGNSYGPIIGLYLSLVKFVWTDGPEKFSNVSPYTSIGPWMALPSASDLKSRSPNHKNCPQIAAGGVPPGPVHDRPPWKRRLCVSGFVFASVRFSSVCSLNGYLISPSSCLFHDSKSVKNQAKGLGSSEFVDSMSGFAVRGRLPGRGYFGPSVPFSPGLSL